MERYGRKHEVRLGEFLELENGVPSHGPMRKECAWDFSSAKRVFLGGEGEEAAA